MSAATAIHTLQEDERLRCQRCSEVFTEGEDMAITAHPDGITVEVRCADCQEEVEAAEESEIFA